MNRRLKIIQNQNSSLSARISLLYGGGEYYSADDADETGNYERRLRCELPEKPAYGCGGGNGEAPHLTTDNYLYLDRARVLRDAAKLAEQ